MKHNYCLSILSSFFVLLILISLTSCGSSSVKFSQNHTEYFDTVTSFTAYNVRKKDEQALSLILDEELNKYHKLFDIYHEYSGITNLKNVNDSAIYAPLEIDSELFEFLEYSIEAYDKTNGYVNIAMGSVLKLWHECRTNSLNKATQAALPDPALLAEASNHTNIEKVVLNHERSTVFLADADMSLDAGAIAKGYAAQKIHDRLKSLGYDDFVLSIGGNIITSGEKKNDQKWQIGIEDPSDTSKNICTLAITDTSVVTSGSYHRYYTVDGIRYHHIINPNTLFPENTYLSVTVICNDSALADISSTALFNMDISEGKDFVAKNNSVEAMWVLNDGSIVYSDGFEAYTSNK